MALNNISDVENYFKASVNSLAEQCKTGNPWVFLTASAFLEYLTKIVNGKDTGPSEYKKFIEDWMPEKYNNFKYKNGKKDLPIQMYHVLRCGIVHSFSLIPDARAKKNNGRDRSIMLGHRIDNPGKTTPYNYSGADGSFDSAAFLAEDFIDDIKTTLEKIFRKADSDTTIKNNILDWIKKHPPITGGF